MRFMADRMLGRLALYLRMLGYDTVYVRQNDAAGMIERSLAEQRIILTRDTRLVRQKDVPPMLFIHDDAALSQLNEIVDHFGLKPERNRWFTRCLRCNAALVTVPARDIAHLVPSYILASHQEFSQCPQCQRVYWRGTHRERMEEQIREILRAVKTTE